MRVLVDSCWLRSNGTNEGDTESGSRDRQERPAHPPRNRTAAHQNRGRWAEGTQEAVEQMNKETLERTITLELARRASASTVDPGRSRVIVKSDGTLTHVLSFKLLDAKAPVRCIPILGVIIPAVERVLRELKPESEGALTLSLDGTNQLSPREPVRVERVDAGAVAGAIWHVFERTASAYFKARQNLSQIERTLNDDLDIIVPDAAHFVRRAEVGIVLARVVGRSDYDAIGRAYIQRVNDFYKPGLEALIARYRGDISLS